VLSGSTNILVACRWQTSANHPGQYLRAERITWIAITSKQECGAVADSEMSGKLLLITLVELGSKDKCSGYALMPGDFKTLFQSSGLAQQTLWAC
jgi:hypothetical protein